MATFIDTLPHFVYDDSGRVVFAVNPGSREGNTFYDGVCGVDWFKNVFPDIANDELPLSKENYEALKNIGECWAINAINWRKSGVIEVEGITAEETLEEEEAFLLEMYPPAPEPEPETQPEQEEEQTEEQEPVQDPEAPADEPTETQTEEQTEEGA